MTSNPLMQRLLDIAEQLSTALETNRERIHNVNAQTEELKRAIAHRGDGGGDAVPQTATPALRPSKGDATEVEEKREYIKPEALPPPSSPDYLPKLERAHAALLEDHDFAMQTVHVLMARIRTQESDIERRVGIIHRDVLDWRDAADELLHAQMQEHTALSKQVNMMMGALRQAAESEERGTADDAAQLQAYLSQIATENAGFRAILAGKARS